MVKLKRNLLSVALASAMTLSATGVYAQSTEATADQAAEAKKDDAVELDRVTVTGIRRGIENAIETKQTSNSIVEAISAEDIGKLPDASIAESIGRLPGLAAQRVAGRASTVSIRGLSDNFGTTLLNGREQVSSGDNRGVEFDQYPSELINQVVVYKTPDASLIGQGLSGTVDLQTVRPLSFADRVISFNVRGEKNSLGELNPGYTDQGYRFSASYIDQFMDNKLGVAFGFARLDTPGQANRWEGYDYPTFNGARLIGGGKSMVSSTDNVRDGLMGVIEFKPNDTYSTVLDMYYSKFERDETTRFMEYCLGWCHPVINPVVENNVVVGGSFSDVKPVLRNDLNTRTDKIFAIGWNNKFTFNENWSADIDLSYSKADRDEMILETYSGIANGGSDTVDFTINPSTGLPNFSYGVDYTDPTNIVLSDPGGWGQDGYVKYPKFKDEMKAFRASAERILDSAVFSSVEFGVNYANREKSREVAEYKVNLRNGRAPVTVPADLLNDPADLSFTGIPGSLSYDVLAAVSQFYDLVSNVHPDIYNKDWLVNEKLTTYYAQMNINADLGSVPMRGNVGVQVVTTDQQSDGFAVTSGANGNVPNPFSGGAKYNDFLPSLNLAFSLPHDQTLRFGLGRQMARPRMDQMRANNNYSVNQPNNMSHPNEWSGSGGNPQLEPWRATALDLSYEKYWASKAYFSLAYFHKDLHSYVYDQTLEYDFSDFIPDPDGPQPISDIGLFTRPVNGEGGVIEGGEAALSLPFDMLWAPLEGFGTQLSYSRTHSSIDPDGPGGYKPSSLPGLSKEVSNITLYYENHGFSTRVSQRSRSSFLGEVQGFGADRTLVFIRGEDVLDVQVGYSFSEGSKLAGLSFLLQVNNATNEPYRESDTTNGVINNNLPRKFIEYGRSVLFGATYKF